MARDHDQFVAEALQLASLKESVVPGEFVEGKVYDTLCDSQVARQLQAQIYNEEEKKQKPKQEEKELPEVKEEVEEKPLEVSAFEAQEPEPVSEVVPLSDAEKELISDALARNQDQQVAEAL